MEVDSSQIEWTAGSPIYGPASIHEGRETVLLKILSDRRRKPTGFRQPRRRDSIPPFDRASHARVLLCRTSRRLRDLHHRIEELAA